MTSLTAGTLGRLGTWFRCRRCLTQSMTLTKWVRAVLSAGGGARAARKRAWASVKVGTDGDAAAAAAC